MTTRLTLLSFLGALTLAAHAQQANDGPVNMKPPFCFALPLVQVNKHDVSVAYPCLINPVTILKPGMVLRSIYMPPIQTESNDLILARKGTMEESYSRETANTSAHQAALPPDVLHEIDRNRKVVWEVKNNFIMAMAQYPTDSMHLVYSTNGADTLDKLQDTSFSFFDGMFIGSPKGDIEAVGVEKTSYSDQAGIKPGDEILAVGDVQMHGDLNAFASAFAKVKAAAKENEQPSFSVTVRSPGGAPRIAAMGMPPSIKNFLNSGL